MKVLVVQNACEYVWNEETKRYEFIVNKEIIESAFTKVDDSDSQESSQ